MRITGGTFKGRVLFAPHTKIRPTQDKVRQAFFSSTAGIIEGCRFLDLFAGSGSVGIEAISRGAAEVCFVELDRKAVSSIHSNLEILDIKCGAEDNRQIKVLNRDAFRYISNPQNTAPFDLIYADPPYFFGDTAERPEMIMRKISENRLLCSGSFFVIEQGVKNKIHEPAGWARKKSAVYGQARLCYYENLNPA